MRTLICTVIMLVTAIGPALADDARTTLGDIPRTYSHYLNAQEAALCRANAATGGIASYFLNPASVTDVADIAGIVTARYNRKTRDYLPSGAENLDASDDGFLFTQFVAVKRSGSLILGFGYSNPSFRDLEITGRRYYDDQLKDYQGEFNGALRYFEVIAAARIGDEGQGGIGVTAGIVNLNEEARERVIGEELNAARLDGIAACFALGFTYDVTDRVTFGIGHRLGSKISVDGEHYDQSRDGESMTQPTTVGGVRVRAADAVTIHASYVQDGWDEASSTLAAYEDAVGEGNWNQFDSPLKTIAIGVEISLMNGKATARAGYSKEMGADIENAVVPENSIGVGGSFAFDQYVAELAVVRERFLEGGDSGKVTNYGVYASVGYEF